MKKMELLAPAGSYDAFIAAIENGADAEKVKTTPKYCRRCGAKIEPDSLFCSSCGTKVV